MNEHDISLVALIVSAGAVFLNIILIPLAKSAARGEVERLISEHNNDANAHPNLDHAKSIEGALKDLAKDTNLQFVALRQEIANLRVDLAISKRDDS